jgi:hypothetical protein
MNLGMKFGVLALTASVLLALQSGSTATAAEERGAFGRSGGRVIDGRGQVLDSRYNHGRYYPAIGGSVRVLPEGYRPYYSAVWIGGLPYYYADGVYYTWNPAQNGYVVVAAPANADQPSAAAHRGPTAAAIIAPCGRA